MILSRSSLSLNKEIAGFRLEAISTINKMIGDTRLIFITDLPGQEATYLEKERQAVAFLSADPEPTDLSSYRYIAKEMEATGWSARVAAQTLANLAFYWRPLAENLEGLRRNYIVQVEEASTKTDIDQLVTDLENTLKVYAGG